MSLFSRNDTQELGCRMLSAEISPPPLLPFLYFHFVKSRFLYFCFLFTHIFLPICKFSWFFKYQTLFSDQDRCPIWVKCYIPAIGYSPQFAKKSEPVVVLLKYLFSYEVFFGHTVHSVFHLAHSVPWLSCFFLGQFSWSVGYFAKAESCLPRLDNS